MDKSLSPSLQLFVSAFVQECVLIAVALGVSVISQFVLNAGGCAGFGCLWWGGPILLIYLFALGSVWIISLRYISQFYKKDKMAHVVPSLTLALVATLLAFFVSLSADLGMAMVVGFLGYPFLTVLFQKIFQAIARK